MLRKLFWISFLPAAAIVLFIGLFLSNPAFLNRVALEGANAAVFAVRWRILGAAALAAILALGGALLMSRSLARRIGRLRQFAESLPDSRISQSPLPDSDDEFGALARSLSRTSGQFRGMVNRLSQEAERREAILASMVEGVVAVDHQLRVTFYNDSFRRLVGISEAIARPVPIIELIRDSALIDMLRQALASSQPLIRRLELHAAQGRIFEAHAGPLGGESPRGAILILHDISSLERLERVRKDFVANVSHELRTPLTAICGYAETLLEGALDDSENNRRFVEIIRNHANRINDIASDLLTLSELESAKPPAVPDRISIRAALDSVLRIIEPEARARKIELICGNIDDAEVSGYRVHFEQAVLNLLQNAVKFNRPGGEVRLSAGKSSDKICIQVSDTGVGIPSEDLSRIFERFYRVDRARSREVGGTGLGLSIVKHIVERMHGSVNVESQLGKGSEFRISLPALLK